MLGILAAIAAIFGLFAVVKAWHASPGIVIFLAGLVAVVVFPQIVTGRRNAGDQSDE